MKDMLKASNEYEAATEDNNDIVLLTIIRTTLHTVAITGQKKAADTCVV